MNCWLRCSNTEYKPFYFGEEYAGDDDQFDKEYSKFGIEYVSHFLNYLSLLKYETILKFRLNDANHSTTKEYYYKHILIPLDSLILRLGRLSRI